MNRRELKSRWDETWHSRASTIRWNIRLRRTLTKGLDDFPRHDELVDLRGLHFSSPVNCTRIRASEVDMSHSYLHAWRFTKCEFVDCSFHGADISSALDRNSCWTNVDFSKACFRDSVIGLGCSRYHGCIFVDTDFRGTAFVSPVFDSCVFSAGKGMSGVDFNASSFRNCVFSGKVDDVVFRNGYILPTDEKQYGRCEPNLMDQVDFTEATLSYIAFSGGVPLDRIEIPPHQNLLLVRNLPEFLAAAKDALCKSTDFSEDEKNDIRDLFGLIECRRNQLHYLIDFALIEERRGPECAERACSFMRGVIKERF